MNAVRILKLDGETWWGIWRRRALSIPLVLTLAVAVAALFPLLLIVFLGIDLLAGANQRLSRTRVFLFFGLYLFCEVWGVLAAGLVWSGLLGGRLGGHARYLAANAALQRSWSGMLFWGAVSIFRLRLTIEGAELAAASPFLLFVRHASTADTVLAAALVANRHHILLKYVIKRELLWDPCLDIVGRRLPNVFVDRSGTRSEAEVRAVVSLAKGLTKGEAVLLYPEGTRFDSRKQLAAVARLSEKGNNDLAAIAGEYRHVMPPKLGGPLGLLEVARGVDIVILEHTGFEGARDFTSFWNGGLIDRELHVRFRRIPAAQIPPAHRDAWLFQEWATVDAWVQSHRNEVPERSLYE